MFMVASRISFEGKTDVDETVTASDAGATIHGDPSKGDTMASIAGVSLASTLERSGLPRALLTISHAIELIEVSYAPSQAVGDSQSKLVKAARKVIEEWDKFDNERK